MAARRLSAKAAVVMIGLGLLIAITGRLMARKAVHEPPAGRNEAFGLMGREVGECLASLLWLKVDSYAHFEVHPAEYLPLVRLVASLDPHFIDAYTLGSYWLCEKMEDRCDEGLAFLEEGIRNNSETEGVDQIHFELGWQLYFRKDDYEAAAREFYAALETITREDGSSIYLVTNYLRLFAWASLMAGYHQTFHDAVMLYDELFPGNSMLGIKQVNKLVEHYDADRGYIDLEAAGASPYIRGNAKPPYREPQAGRRFILDFIKELPAAVTRVKRQADEHGVSSLGRDIDPSIAGIPEEAGDVRSQQSADEHDPLHEGHHHCGPECDHDHGDIWNKRGSWLPLRDGIIPLLLGLVCFIAKRRT